MIWKYITGLALIYGVIGIRAVIANFNPDHKEDISDSILIVIGTLAWAWLLARYLL